MYQEKKESTNRKQAWRRWKKGVTKRKKFTRERKKSSCNVETNGEQEKFLQKSRLSLRRKRLQIKKEVVIKNVSYERRKKAREEREEIVKPKKEVLPRNKRLLLLCHFLGAPLQQRFGLT